MAIESRKEKWGEDRLARHTRIGHYHGRRKRRTADPAHRATEQAGRAVRRKISHRGLCPSNFLNSGIMAMYVLVQYRSQSLIEHLRRAWRIGGRIKQHFITVVPPQMNARGGWYEGTADAVYHNLNLV